MLDVKSENTVRLFIAPDLRHGNVIALVDDAARGRVGRSCSRRIQDALADALHGTLVYFYLALGEGYTAHLHFCFFADPPKAPVIRRPRDGDRRSSRRRWDDRLRRANSSIKFGPKRGRALAEKWTGAFSAEYQAAIDVARAVGDIEDVETLFASGRDFIVEAEPQRGRHADEATATSGLSGSATRRCSPT